MVSLRHRIRLPSSWANKEPVTLGVIGGTGLYHLACLTPVARVQIDTPWGSPSSPITISRTASGFPIAFLSRHGLHHEFTPSDVPSRANIAAFKKLGVKAIIAFSAVGSLQEHIRPRDFVIPTQIIDRTKGIRPSSFFEKGFVGHVGFGDPFDKKLGQFLGQFGHVLKGEKEDVNAGKGDHKDKWAELDVEGTKSAEEEHSTSDIILHTRATEGKDLTLVCMEGPAFSTRAESWLYRSWGGSVINMSAIPESKLAKEAEIAYQMICMSTDYDAWREDEEPVTVETVVGNLKANSANAHALIEAVLIKLEDELVSKRIGYDLDGSMKFAVSTGPEGRNQELKAKLEFLHPGYWPQN